MAATGFEVNFKVTGLQYANTTINEIMDEFRKLVKEVFSDAKSDGVLRYNDVRPLMSDIAGVDDFDTFLLNGGTVNVPFSKEEYPVVGVLDFS